MLNPQSALTDLDSSFQQTISTLIKWLGTHTYRITSAKRDPAKNTAVGGVKDSSHENGLALDVAHDGDILKAMRLAYALGRANVVRVGFYDRHVHFDVDKTKPQVQWEGKSK